MSLQKNIMLIRIRRGPARLNCCLFLRLLGNFDLKSLFFRQFVPGRLFLLRKVRFEHLLVLFFGNMRVGSGSAGTCLFGQLSLVEVCFQGGEVLQVRVLRALGNLERGGLTWVVMRAVLLRLVRLH